MHVSELDTPALLIDLDIFERNLARVADYTRANGLRLRPHTKTHKIPAVGRRQLASGAVGLTVAKVGEAEVMAQSGTPDLLVAYPVIGSAKLDRLAAVARQTRVTVALDSAIAARQLSDAACRAEVNFGVLAEVDVGLGRIGVRPGDELLALARSIGQMPRLTFDGITFYPGHIKHPGEEAQQQALRDLGAVVQSMLEDFRRAGIETRVVSGGSTPTLFRSHEIAGLNEVRPGTYVYNDVNTVESGVCAWEDCAVSIVTTVISTARKGHMIVDGGSKTFSSDRIGSPPTFGRIVEAPECVLHNLNEEHGFVDTRAASREFSVGDRVRVIPIHVCVAVNLHEQVYGVRGEKVETIWKVEGRGKLQ
jgi:D-serine deaminase-like pyridoxal phosphate-dependent protein